MINDFKENIITKEIFDDMLKKDQYFEGRWDYYEEIITHLQNFDDINSVLEIGPYSLPFVKHSDIMDFYDFQEEYPFEIGKFIQHDCSETPFPIEDKSYDLVIACQVLEHLGFYGEQAEVFKEIKRISNKALISLPFLWYRPAHRDHHMIDRRMINTWFDGMVPTFEYISGNEYSLRILQYYEFDKDPIEDDTYLKQAMKEDADFLFKRSNLLKKQKRLVQKIEKENEQILKNNKQFKTKNKELISKNTDLKQQNKKLNNKISSLESKNQELNKELNALKNSTSWKITKPLRDLKSKF